MIVGKVRYRYRYRTKYRGSRMQLSKLHYITTAKELNLFLLDRERLLATDAQLEYVRYLLCVPIAMVEIKLQYNYYTYKILLRIRI